MKKSVFLAIACAGCASYPLPAALPGGVRPEAPSWMRGRWGISTTGLFFADPEIEVAGYSGAKIKAGFYADLRYRHEFGRHLGVEVSAGYFHSDVTYLLDIPLLPAEEIEVGNVDCFPVRLTATVGGESRNRPVRWFLGGGGGYLIFGIENATPEDPLENELAAHAIIGFELRPTKHVDFPICTRVAVEHIWPFESKRNAWLLGCTFFAGF